MNAGRSGAIGAMASPLLDIGEGAVYDIYGNPVRAAAGLPVDVPDTIPPEIVSATYDNSTGLLSLIFSEPLNHTATDHSGLAVLGSSGNITLAAAADRGIPDDDAIAATLGPDQRGMVGASPVLRASRGAVTDVSGNQIEPVTVPVGLSANVPPTVDAGPDLGIPEGAIVSLNGTASDADGDILSYRWSHGPVLAVQFDDPSSPSTSFTAPQVNATTALTLTLAVSDGNATTSDSLVLTISDIPDNHPPEVEAGPDLGIPEGAIVSLNGTASDADGDILSYRWSHGPVLAVQFDDPSSPSTSFTAPQVNATTALTLTLAVSDGNATTSDSLVLTISDIPDNHPPEVEAGPDLGIPEGAIVSLNGTASDADGDILSYRWSHGPVLAVQFDDPSSPSTSFTAPQVNATTALTLTLAVSDGNATTSDSLVLTISDIPDNHPPEVEAGPDLGIPEGAIVSLNGTASDADGDILSYRWSHGPVLAVQFDDPSSPSTSFTAPQVNATTTLTLTLAVSDGNATTSDSLVLTISDIPDNHPPEVEAGPDLGIPEGAIVSLNGTASDADGDILSYRWSHGPVLAVQFDDPSSPSTSFTAPQVNATTTLTLTLAVSDGNATTSDSLVLTISDIPDNHPPEVEAGPDLGIPEGAIVSLNGTASDADGDILSYRWSHGPVLAVQFDDPSSPSTSFTAPQVNATTTLTLTLAVSDGNATTSDSLVLTISDIPDNHPPEVEAGPDLGIPEGAIVSLNGTASDADGDILSYRWSHGPVLAVQFDDPSSPSTSFTAPQVNATTTLTLTLAVSDGNNHHLRLAGPDHLDILSYRWSHGPVLAVQFDDPSSPSTSFTAPQVNATTTLTLTLAVSDGNATTSDSLVLTISDVPDNILPTVDAASLNGTDMAVDTTPPVLTLNGGAKVQVTKGVTYVDPGYTAVDDMDGNITDMVMVTGSVNTDAAGSYTLSYDVADRAGNAAVTQNRTVTVAADDIPPVITLKGQQTMNVEGRAAYVEPGYTATDREDGDLTANVTVTGTVNTTKTGTYRLHYDVTDSSGNVATRQVRTIQVVDVTPPTITLAGQTNMTIQVNSAYADPGYAATDDYDGDLAARVVVAGTVDTARIGTYTLHYDVSDSSGNQAVQQSRTIQVVDVTPPTITLAGQTNMTIQVNSAYADPGYAATDDYDGDLAARVVVAGTVDTARIGTYTLHYDVSDSSGNQAVQQSRTIQVVDVTPPTITLAGQTNMTIQVNSAYADPGYAAADDYDGNLAARVVVAGTVDTITIGTYRLHYDVTDSSGNAATRQVRTVHVVAVTPPMIALSGSSTVTVPFGSVYSEPGYTATDPEEGDLTASVVVTGTVDTSKTGTYTLYYDVSDSFGNKAVQQTRTVRVADVTAPTIALAGQTGMTIRVNTTYADPGYAATDDHDGDLTARVTVTGTVDATKIGTYTIYYDVSDSSGNRAVQLVRTVHVADIPDPQAGLPEVVKRYDANRNGVIDHQEWLVAVNDYANSELTTQEIQAIASARS